MYQFFFDSPYGNFAVLTRRRERLHDCALKICMAAY